MSNFALGRLVRMALVGAIGFGVARLLLASTALGVHIPPQQHPVLAGSVSPADDHCEQTHVIHPFAWLALFALAYVVFLPAYSAREGIVWRLKRCAAGLAVYMAAYGVLTWKGNPGLESVLIAGAAGYVVGVMFPKRSRHIPAAVKRSVARRDLPAGARKKDYHFDHRWPFARGGSHTEDNLRLIPKTENLRKGKKRPRLKDWL